VINVYITRQTIVKSIKKNGGGGNKIVVETMEAWCFERRENEI